MRTQGSPSATKGQQMATSVHDDLEQDRQGRPPRQSMDKVVFGVAAGLALVFLLYGALDSEGFGKSTGSTLGWITTNFGWFFVLTSGAFLLFSVFLAVTR